MDHVGDIARKLGVRREALKKWYQRKRVPHRWRIPILEEARQQGITLDPAVFDALPPRRSRRVPERLAQAPRGGVLKVPTSQPGTAMPQLQPRGVA